MLHATSYAELKSFHGELLRITGVIFQFWVDVFFFLYNGAASADGSTLCGFSGGKYLGLGVGIFEGVSEGTRPSVGSELLFDDLSEGDKDATSEGACETICELVGISNGTEVSVGKEEGTSVSIEYLLLYDGPVDGIKDGTFVGKTEGTVDRS